MRRIVQAVTLLLCLATAAQASVMSYQCRFPEARSRDWVQPLIFVGHDTDSGRVVISDAGILHFNDGQPAEGSVTREAGRLVVRWQVRMRAAFNARVLMRYRAEIDPESGAVTVLASGRNQSILQRRTGQCVIRELS
jgi:hypothetical protein